MTIRLGIGIRLGLLVMPCSVEIPETCAFSLRGTEERQILGRWGKGTGMNGDRDGDVV